MENLPERFGREFATNLACNAENVECLEDTFRLVIELIDRDQKIPNGLESIVCHGMRGDSKLNEFVRLWQKMQATTDANYKTTLINGLGCTGNATLLFEYLETSLGSGQNVVYTTVQRQAVFSAALQSKSAIPAMIKFLQKFWREAVSTYRFTLSQIVTTIGSSIKTSEDRELFLDFLRDFEPLSSDDYRAVDRIIANNMNQQKLAKYADQIQLMSQIFPWVPLNEVEA